MNILIVGTGYVGLVTGACFAQMGHKVICLDIDEEKISSLKKGKAPFFEPRLEELIAQNTKANRLSFTTDYPSAVRFCEVCFIAVPTPQKEDGSCEIEFVKQATKEIAKYMERDLLLVNKSTVPVGTAKMSREWVEEILNKRGVDFAFSIVSNPEFLKEGSAVEDCLKPDRIIIGVENSSSIDTMKKIYSGFTISHERFLVMDTLSAEMTKYAANAMLATRISFMNEMAEICARLGANVNEVRKGIGSDKRIGYHFLYPGVGYGGSCFPKDLQALIALSTSKGYPPTLLQTVEAINERQKKVLSEKMKKYFLSKGGVKGKTIAVWGLSFKPDTDDIRKAPSLTFIEELLKEGAHLRLYDPVAMDNAKALLKNLQNISWCSDETDAAKGSDAVALLTEWKQFRLINAKNIKDTMQGCAFFDGRNQYKAEEMKKHGFDYIGIGVPNEL